MNDETCIYYCAGIVIGILAVGDILVGAAAGAGTIALAHLSVTYFFPD